MDRNMEVASFERELCTFYEYCKENNFSPDEMKIIFSPLRNVVLKKKIYHFTKLFAIALVFVLFLYMLSKTETVVWHASAVGRIGLIQVLPLWNWQKLFAEKCLIRGMVPSEKEVEFDCTLCESIEEVSYEKEIDPVDLKDVYLDVNNPVVVDGFRYWIGGNMSEVLLNNSVLAGSYPCELSTNVMGGRDVVLEMVVRKSLRFKKWFVHFQNCEEEAVKAFRGVVARPGFLPAELSPVRYSWVLMSKDYNSGYKRVGLKEKYGVVIQIFGSNKFRMIPRKNCVNVCNILDVMLLPGESVVFGSLWDLEYKPGDGMNVAVILEV